jgi:ribosomal protein S18 acetylase RimI-like enzyme
MMQIRAFQPQDEASVIALWQTCELTRPWNDPRKDIARKLTVQPELFVVGIESDALIASAMFGFDGHRGWVNYLAVSPAHQRRGYASALMRWGEQALQESGCPKINLQIRSSNATVIAFYKTLDYNADDVVSLGKRLIPDL